MTDAEIDLWVDGVLSSHSNELTLRAGPDRPVVEAWAAEHGINVSFVDYSPRPYPYRCKNGHVIGSDADVRFSRDRNGLEYRRCRPCQAAIDRARYLRKKSHA